MFADHLFRFCDLLALDISALCTLADPQISRQPSSSLRLILGSQEAPSLAAEHGDLLVLLLEVLRI